jgi:hypothetical protein
VTGFSTVQAAGLIPVHIDTDPSTQDATDSETTHKTIQLATNLFAYIVIDVRFEGHWTSTSGDAIQVTCNIKFDDVTQKSQTLRQSDPTTNSHIVEGHVILKTQQRDATEITVTLGGGNADTEALVESVQIYGVL